MQSAAMDKLMRLALEDKPLKVSSWLCLHSGVEISQPSEGYSNAVPFRAPAKKLHIASSETKVCESFQELNHG